MEKRFREDYLDMNHTILELLLNLSGNYIEDGKITQKSVLFKKKTQSNGIHQHWDFYLKKNRPDVFPSDKDAHEERGSTDYNVELLNTPENTQKEVFIIGRVIK